MLDYFQFKVTALLEVGFYSDGQKIVVTTSVRCWDLGYSNAFLQIVAQNKLDSIRYCYQMKF